MPPTSKKKKEKKRSSPLPSSFSSSSLCFCLVPPLCPLLISTLKKKTQHRGPPCLYLRQLGRICSLPDMITDEHYISFQLTKHGHQCGTAPRHTGLRGRGVAWWQKCTPASKYGQICIWIPLWRVFRFQNNTMLNCRGPNKCSNKWGWVQKKMDFGQSHLFIWGGGGRAGRAICLNAGELVCFVFSINGQRYPHNKEGKKVAYNKWHLFELIWHTENGGGRRTSSLFG